MITFGITIAIIVLVFFAFQEYEYGSKGFAGLLCLIAFLLFSIGFPIDYTVNAQFEDKDSYTKEINYLVRKSLNENFKLPKDDLEYKLSQTIDDNDGYKNKDNVIIKNVKVIVSENSTTEKTIKYIYKINKSNSKSWFDYNGNESMNIKVKIDTSNNGIIFENL